MLNGSACSCCLLRGLKCVRQETEYSSSVDIWESMQVTEGGWDSDPGSRAVPG